MAWFGTGWSETMPQLLKRKCVRHPSPKLPSSWTESSNFLVWYCVEMKSHRIRRANLTQLMIRRRATRGGRMLLVSRSIHVFPLDLGSITIHLPEKTA